MRTNISTAPRIINANAYLRICFANPKSDNNINFEAFGFCGIFPDLLRKTLKDANSQSAYSISNWASILKSKDTLSDQ